ncbi:hypothetical protein M409DRAFT_26410 [Zasmidium cellare ATCC 36951]|uniref:AB hydrolase-1 domain-containing protein n=1 Tax=Zasmidium cellare ATCC 36951 TaxID=1080233 RepID=A0A6A6C963_ZASCE|nr:uncharacterized protein M409DRAFT_26410 [Zasmidium cellare ATCC 36951]KAF2163373.1 hypothetical protein M409DRAFT_26410 [Zasmidium cellare ATCC 36951]
MLKDSPGNRWTIRSVISILQAYGPFCLAYTIWVLAARFWQPLSFGRDRFLNNYVLWSLWAPEAVFYLFFVGYNQYIQRKAIHPPKRSPEERRALFSKVRSEIYDPAVFLSGWFRGSPVEDIGREELRRFTDWAFWDGRAGEVGEKGDADEIEEYIDKMERMMPKGFLEGPGKARSLRLTLDPVEIEPRTLLWYSLIMLVDTFTISLFLKNGFEYHRRTLPRLAAVFPPRPAALLTRHVSVVPDFSYVLRRHTSKTRLPIVFIHGIGVGLLTHVTFLNELHRALNAGASEDDQVGIVAIEVLQISSRITTSIPRRVEFVSQLTNIINHHFGTGRFVLASHSYGSVMSTHVMNDPHLSPRISATLLIDPVSILLHMPDVAYNFTVRPPVRANEWQLWYFASKDPQIAHTLGRYFFWSENVLWRDQIDHLMVNHNMRLTASLGSDDLIVKTNAVRAYLAERDLPDPVLVEDVTGHKQMHLRTHMSRNPEKSKRWRGSGLEVLWWDGYDHAAVFDIRQDRAKLVEVLVEYVKGT